MIVRPVLCRPFIGRLDELAYLRERRLEAGSSRGGLVLVAGDAGVGKSRLITEFCNSLAYSRWRIGLGACVEFGSRPYGPILQALAQLHEVPFELGDAATKSDQFDTIVARIAEVAERRAAILAVEDLHWADAATLDFLAYLSTKIERIRVLVLVTFRADELHPEHVATAATAKMGRNACAGRIDLGPLRGADLRRFIDEALSGTTLSEQTRRKVALAGDGNPFFTEELLKNAVERQSRSAAARGEKTDLPQTLRSALLERLRPFDEPEKQVVAQAAMIGRTFSLELLASTLEREPQSLLPTLRRARDFQLVEEVSPAVFRFRHGLTREAIYPDFLDAELQIRHRAIAQTLEKAPAQERVIEALAYHWWASGDAANAARYNEAAGDAAARVHAHEDAIAFYERALEFDLQPLLRGTLVNKIANHRLSLGWTKEAQAAYSSAAGLFLAAGESEREASARVTAAITAYGIGLPEPTAPLEAMLERLDGDAFVARSRVHLGLAWLTSTFGFPTKARAHLIKVDVRAREQAPDIALRFHNVAAFVAMTLGDIGAFGREYGAWLDAARASGSLHVLAGAYTNGAMAFAFFGMHEEAERNLGRALGAAAEAQSRHSVESVHAFAAMCAYVRGDLERARRELDRVSPASENRVSLTFATAWGTLVGAALGDRTLIERWFDGFEASVWASPEVECGAGFAEILVRRGRPDEATRLLHDALPRCETVRGNVSTLLAVARYGARADRVRARAYLERAADAPVETPERAGLALFDALELVREERGSEAALLAREAAGGFRRMRMPLFEAQALEAAGDISAALALFRRCGATHDVTRLVGTAASAEGSDAAPQTLSAREREVAALAAAGRSNLDIARSLSITHKTVEKHLGSVYQKLGISSRAELAARAARVTREADERSR